MNVSTSVARVHSDHHDFRGGCAACCHDVHPGGESILRITDQGLSEYKCAHECCPAQLMNKESMSAFGAESSGDLEHQVSVRTADTRSFCLEILLSKFVNAGIMLCCVL